MNYRLGVERGQWQRTLSRQAFPSYGTSVVNCPGIVMLITPAQLHIHLEVLSSAGKLLIVTVGAPGTQGEAVTGMHGMGVSTPSAAAVAAATSGLARLMHIPKGGIFAIGAKSMIVAAGMPLTVVVGALVAMSDAGAAPNVHIIIAPMTTCSGIVCSLSVAGLSRSEWTGNDTGCNSAQ
jgi:hypothetical protein